MRITIQTKGGEFEVDCEAGDNMLYAGLKAGVTLPYECGTGTCGTCRCRVMEGDWELTWADAPGLAYVKQEKSETLMCQARMKGDCIIRVPGEITKEDSGPDHFCGRLENLQRLTHDVASFSVPLDRPMDFMAGQFVVLEAPGLDGGRAYSMTNYGTGVSRLDFVVKRKPGGGVSDWLFAGSPVGIELGVFGPLGRATFDPAEDKNVVCIAGGSGIAGMMAILDHGVASGHFADHTAHVFFGVRTEKDIFFAEEFRRSVEKFPDNVNVTIALSDAQTTDGLAEKYPGLNFATGFVHAVASERMSGNYDNMVGYVAGPPPMVDGALRMLVLEARLPGTDIRYDKFS
ncbi:MAG: 2Fe-2S iron-sulfur cluster-binding protein [Rhodospirillaceae bacterium]